MGILFCWARPRFLVVLLDLRRNANLAGGFAGRRVLVVRLGYVYLICLRFLILANRAEYHFFHRLCIYQDRATEHLRPNSRGKKKPDTKLCYDLARAKKATDGKKVVISGILAGGPWVSAT